MRVLRENMSGTDIIGWQHFLRGRGFYQGVSDGTFGPYTKEATMRFQSAVGLVPDGVVGNLTFAEALKLGLNIVQDTQRAVDGPNWPPLPNGLRPLASSFDKSQVFGAFDYDPAPTAACPEAIRIKGEWVEKNIARVAVKQLASVRGAPADGRVLFHKAVADQLVLLFEAWEEAGLTDHILTWDGSFSARYVRGSRTLLSNHAWATAFDINAPQNPLGAQPAFVGKPGSVRELVAIANEYGFYWGGHFSGRPDGMHFEAAKIL